MKKPIVTIPNDVLFAQAKTVTAFDKRLQKLITTMSETLNATKKPKGVGLAAPQIGESVRVFLTKPTDKAEIRVFINPEILQIDDTVPGPKEDDKLEGCLSIPGVWGKVDRHHKVLLAYQNEQGEKLQEWFTGFMAVIVQHETDHTNGILFTSRVAEQKGKFYTNAVDEDGKEILEELSI